MGRDKRDPRRFWVSVADALRGTAAGSGLIRPLTAAARHGTISLEELTGLPVIHGPRRARPVTYDAWLTAMQAVDPRFEFTDPHPLTASAVLVWSADLPRPLQQMLLDTASSLTEPAPPLLAALISLTTA